MPANTCKDAVPVRMSVQLCYLVRWDGGEEELLYDPIEELDYEWGHSYVIEVATATIEDPPADGSPISYRMVKLLEKNSAGRPAL